MVGWIFKIFQNLCRNGRGRDVLKNFDGWKFLLPPDSKTTDKPNLQPISNRPNFLFYPPINKLKYKFNRFLEGENEKGTRN